MAYYVLYDKKGNYMGYSTEKELAYGLIKQRKPFQKLNIEKFKNSFFDDKAKYDLYMSSGEIFSYHGTYLFEHEQDDIHNNCLEYYKKVYESITGYNEAIALLKFKDDDKEIVAQFTKEIIHMGECILDEYYCSEDPYYDCFKVSELAIHFLKKLYKETK